MGISEITLLLMFPCGTVAGYGNVTWLHVISEVLMVASLFFQQTFILNSYHNA